MEKFNKIDLNDAIMNIQELIEEFDKKNLHEDKHSIKKKIFSLSKMENLVHNDPKLSRIYDKMAEGGAEKFGYHYNEMIMNVIFNDYILNDVKYLRKYRNAIGKKKKRRDKSGINQLRKDLNPELAKTINSVDETTGSASSGSYSGPAAWSSDGKTHGKMAWANGTIVEENVYIDDVKKTDSETEKRDVTYINSKSSEFGTVLDLRDESDLNIIKNDIKTKKYDSANLVGGVNECVNESENYLIDPKGFSKYFDMINEEMNSMATSTTQNSLLKSKESMKLKEPLTQGASGDGDSTIADSEPITENKNKNMQYTEINKQLDEDLKLLNSIKATEPKTLGELEKLKKENKTNAKDIGKNVLKNVHESLSKNATAADYIKDFTNSTDKRFEEKTKEQRRKMALAAFYNADRIDEAKENEYTEVGDPYALAQKLEKEQLAKSKDALKNKGNNPSADGKNVVKRNLTTDEEKEVELNRGLGMQDIVYDNKIEGKFEDRIKKEMGDDLFKSRQEKLKNRANAPMYNKDTQPTSNGDKKETSNRYTDNLSESFVNGKYVDGLGNKRFLTFKFSQVESSDVMNESWHEISFSGMGNMYNKVSEMSINENTVTELEKNKYYFDESCKCIHSVENKIESLNEGKINEIIIK